MKILLTLAYQAVLKNILILFLGSTHILTPTKFLEDAHKLSTQQIIYEINSTVVTENEIDTTQNGSK